MGRDATIEPAGIGPVADHQIARGGVFRGEDVLAQRQADAALDPGIDLPVDEIKRVARPLRRCARAFRVRYPAQAHAGGVVAVGIGDAVVFELQRVSALGGRRDGGSKRHGCQQPSDRDPVRHRHGRGYPVRANGLKRTSRS